MPIKKENIIRIMNGTVIRINYGNLEASTSTLILMIIKKVLIDVGHYGTRLRMLENLKKE